MTITHEEFTAHNRKMAEALPEDWREARKTYKIVRNYFSAWPNHRTILSGLTLAEAQAHCSDPETSSSTCVKSAGRARTRRLGDWFDGYDEER